jgi:son of sevenless-like protein
VSASSYSTLYNIICRVWYILKLWTESHFYDFQDEEMITEYKKFIDTIMVKDMDKLAIQLKGILDRQLTKSFLLNKQKIGVLNAPPPVLPSSDPDTWKLLDLDPLEIARQLTLTDYEYYYKIQPKECLNQSWTKKQDISPNILALVKRFNQLGKYVITSVVREPDPQKRAGIVLHFIKLAVVC